LWLFSLDGTLAPAAPAPATGAAPAPRDDAGD
jgi:hypothetical protein